MKTTLGLPFTTLRFSFNNNTFLVYRSMVIFVPAFAEGVPCVKEMYSELIQKGVFLSYGNRYTNDYNSLESYKPILSIIGIVGISFKDHW